MLKNETTMFNVSVKFLGGCAMEWRNGGGGGEGGRTRAQVKKGAQNEVTGYFSICTYLAV